MKYRLTPKATLFNEIIKQEWWSLLKEDQDFYINIRKDNYINIYYYGGSVAKIEYAKGNVVAHIHEKYLGITDGIKYTTLDLQTLDKHKVSNIKRLIKEEYLSRTDDERRAEKWIQGDIIIRDRANFIDSEFAYNKDSEIGRLRVDITQLTNGELRFIELKGIYNPELMTENPSENEPHIIEQITRYRAFVKRYSNDIINYYQTLCNIKEILGIGNKVEIKSINPEPLLWIENTYNRETVGRINRIAQIETLLKNHNIDYKICK